MQYVMINLRTFRTQLYLDNPGPSKHTFLAHPSERAQRPFWLGPGDTVAL